MMRWIGCCGLLLAGILGPLHAAGQKPQADPPPLTIEQILKIQTHEQLLPLATAKAQELAELLAGATTLQAAYATAPAAERCYLELELLGSRMAMLPRPRPNEVAALQVSAGGFLAAKHRLEEQWQRARLSPGQTYPLQRVLQPLEMQFKGAQEQRLLSLVSTLQTLRAQIELYKLQHRDLPPQFETHGWTQLTNKTDEAGRVSKTGAYGPYLQADPVNPLNGSSTVLIRREKLRSDFCDMTGKHGYVLETSTGRFYALDKHGRLFHEDLARAALE